MNVNNTYKVFYKTTNKKDSSYIETIAEFECDMERYMYEVEKALKNGLVFTASDCAYNNEKGGRNYFVSIYIW